LSIWSHVVSIAVSDLTVVQWLSVRSNIVSKVVSVWLSIRSEAVVVSELTIVQWLSVRSNIIVSKVVSELAVVQWLSVWSNIVSKVVSIWLTIRSEAIVHVVSKVVSVWLSVRSESIVHVVSEVVSRLTVVHVVSELTIVVHAIGVLAIVVHSVGVLAVVSVHGRKDASHFVVVGNSTQWVLAKTPRSHGSVGGSGNCAPRELHASVGRKDSIGGTSVVSDSVANEWELTHVGELG